MSSSVVWCKQCMKNMCQKLLYTQYSTTFPNLLYKQYMHISLRKTITHFNQWEQQRGKWEEKSSYQLNSRSITTLKSCDFTHPTSCLTYVKKKNFTANYWQTCQPNHLLLHCCSYTDWLHQYHECENKLVLENYLLYKLRQILYLLYR